MTATALRTRLARYEVLFLAGDLSYGVRIERLRRTIEFHESGEAARLARIDDENDRDGNVAIGFRNA